MWSLSVPVSCTFATTCSIFMEDDQPSYLEISFGWYALASSGCWMVLLCNKLRSLLTYLPTTRTSYFSTQGIQIDDPNNALSYFSILIYVISLMHILISIFILKSFSKWNMLTLVRNLDIKTNKIYGWIIALILKEWLWSLQQPFAQNQFFPSLSNSFALEYSISQFGVSSTIPMIFLVKSIIFWLMLVV